MITDTEVEISTEECCEEEDEEMVTLMDEPEPEPDHEPVRKKRGETQKSWMLAYLSCGGSRSPQNVNLLSLTLNWKKENILKPRF